jgi:hypothetical protein
MNPAVHGPSWQVGRPSSCRLQRRGHFRLLRRLRCLPRSQSSRRARLSQESSWSPRRQCGALLFSPAVPPTCQKQRSPTVSSGQSRSLRGGRWAGRTSLTWGGGGGRNCMACKGSGVQIPSAPPGTTWGGGGGSRGYGWSPVQVRVRVMPSTTWMRATTSRPS